VETIIWLYDACQAHDKFDLMRFDIIEAHHVHSRRMAWFKSIQDIHHIMVKAMNIVGNDAMTLAPVNVG
jgi:hypothetical protein